MTDVTLGASGLWLGTRTVAGGTATLTKFFFLAEVHGSMDNRNRIFLPDVLCDHTDLVWRKGTLFEAVTGPTAIIDGLLAEVFRGFPQSYGKCQDMYAQSSVSFYYLSYH